MAQSLTDMINSISTISEDDQNSEVLWMTQVIGMIKKLKDNHSTDCCIIVGETRIPVHNAVVQLNSSMLTSRSVSFDAENEITEIEIEPEIEENPDLVKDIVQSFYSGKIDINEADVKQAYKFSAIYEIGWLKIHSRRLIVNYLTKSVYGCYERFTEILTFVHFIWDTDLFECCIQEIDEEVLEFLIKDEEMLGKMSYKCMEIITMSTNVGFPEKDLFDLLVAWVTCKKQTCKKNFQELFKNLRYDSMNKDFINKHVMRFVSQNEGIFSVSFLKNILDSMSDSSKDRCRSARMKEIALRRVQIVIDTLESSDKKKEEKANELNSFLIRKDIRYLPDEKKEELSSTIQNKRKDFIASLDWLSVVNLINLHQSYRTADIFVDTTFYNRSVPEFYKLDWTKVTDKAISCVLAWGNSTSELYISYVYGAIEVAMTWCLANRDTTDDATLERVVSGICYNRFLDLYKSDILLPTIRHLLPNTTELKCQHSGECLAISTLSGEIKTVNEKLYMLEPFEDDVATLSDKNGVLELRWKDPDNVAFTLFIKDRPYEPFYAVSDDESVDDETLRSVIAALKDNDKINLIVMNITASDEDNASDEDKASDKDKHAGKFWPWRILKLF